MKEKELCRERTAIVIVIYWVLTRAVLWLDTDISQKKSASVFTVEGNGSKLTLN
jgi:hypothetical protein